MVTKKEYEHTDDTTKLKKTFEELGWYVYALAYPKAYTKNHKDKQGIFYIGKGIGNRVLQHIEDAKNTTLKTDKLETIRAIQNEKFEVDYYILRHQIPSEEEAYRIESVCIDLLSYEKFEHCCLKNDVKGHGQSEFGIKTLDELNEEYGNLPYLSIDDDNTELLCICINQQFGQLDEEGKPISVYDAVRGSWKLDPSRANRCKYVIAEYHGISRGVFKVNKNGWQQCNDKPKRYFFVGKDISNTQEGQQYMNCILPERKKGSANPCRYLNKENSFRENRISIDNKQYPVVLICVNRTYGKLNEDGNEITAYEAVRSSWVLNPENANKCKYIIAEHNNKCVGVFVTDENGWQQSNVNPKRYYFNGKKAPKKIQEKYKNMELPKREQGVANPVRYFDL